MSDSVIKVENLGKCYRIKHQQREPYVALRDVLTHKFRNLFQTRNVESKPLDADEDFWALKDVSFDIKAGEVVGIIGRNGAGKSTLLKILSRITDPTRGRVKLRGRVASLLEVGTGFHPELTGRENIYLNGAILGMRRAEIRKKFDEIVAFAEVDKFLDTPVKRYSSGMYVRLAFAVAAHLEPEILIVDEVLAVGDAEFQKKCLGKMQDVAKGGRTVLFVSHNMQAVSTLCTRAILLKSGMFQTEGRSIDVIHHYLSSSEADENLKWNGDEGDDVGRLLKTWVRSTDPTGVLHTAADFEIGIKIRLLAPVRGLILGFRIVSEYGTELVYSLFDDSESSTTEVYEAGAIEKRFVIPKDFLGEGTYKVRIAFGIHNKKAIVLNTHGTLTIILSNTKGIGRHHLGVTGSGFQSIIRPKLNVY